MWELDPLVKSINKLDVNNTTDDVGDWYINEELNLAYFFVFASDSVLSDTSTDVDNDLWSVMDALTSLHVPRSHPSKCNKMSVMRENQYSWSPQDAKDKN